MIFGKQKKEEGIHRLPKDGYFDFERIASYDEWKQNETSFQNINDDTWADLDMDEVFMNLDRTHSKPGQQFLYYLLRTIPSDDRSTILESTVSKLKTDEKKSIQLVHSLKKLNNRGSYFLHSLFTKEGLKKPKWFGFVYLLLLLTITSAIGFFFYPPLILITICCLLGNFIVHYWNKSKLMEYSNAISQLYRLDRASEKVSFLYSDPSLAKAQRSLKSLSRKSALLRDNVRSQNDLSVVAESMIEILKASLLVEPILLFRVADEIAKKKNELKQVFETVGFADACISILTLRTSMNYCTPQFTTERVLQTSGCFHPLIEDPTSNSILINEGHSVLISGSNMSGKTTFIRTLGINAMLSQTINMAFAEEWLFSKSRIFSAIRISDDLLNDESFYLKEVKVLQEMIDESQSNEKCLFLIDELYKGTNSIERIGAGVSVLSYLQNKHCLVCASTHDLELSEYLGESYANYHFTEEVDQEAIRFDYKLRKGKLQNTNALRILETNGYPDEITKKARKIAEELAKKS